MHWGQRRKKRLGEFVRQPVVAVELDPAHGRQRGAAHPAIAGLLLFDGDEALRLQRAQQAAEIGGIEVQQGTQVAYLAPVDADLEQKPRFAKRPAPAEIAVLQDADALRDLTAEQTDLPDVVAIHYLTLVR